MVFSKAKGMGKNTKACQSHVLELANVLSGAIHPFSTNILLCHHSGGGCLWKLEGRSQGVCYTTHMCKAAPSPKNSTA